MSVVMDLNLDEHLREQIRCGLQLAATKAKAETIRELLTERREERIVRRYATLAENEHLFLAAVTPPIDWDNIEPELHWTTKGDERKIWDYARNIVSSAPDSGFYGRRMYYHFIDRNSGRWLGIVCVASALGHSGPRDSRLGWDVQTKYNHLANVLNIQTCVPIQPFGMLCGGKLLFISSLSNEVRVAYKEKYGSNLLAVETTSLYGKASQYNRIKEFEYLGLTKGFGCSHISDDLWSLMRQYLVLHPEYDAAGVAKMKMRLIDHVTRAVGLPGYGSNHGQGRGYYWGVTATNSEDLLCGEQVGIPPDYYDRPLAELTAAWKERWYKMRLGKKRNEALSFDPSIYRLENNVPSDLRENCQSPVQLAMSF